MEDGASDDTIDFSLMDEHDGFLLQTTDGFNFWQSTSPNLTTPPCYLTTLETNREFELDPTTGEFLKRNRKTKFH